MFKSSQNSQIIQEEFAFNLIRTNRNTAINKKLETDA